MPFEDSMKKVAALTWAPSGKKFAVGAADRVTLNLFSLSISSMRTDKKEINFPPNLPTKDRKVISFEDFNFHQIPKKWLWVRVTT